MDEVVKDVLHDKIGEKEYKKKIESVKRFERQLTDNGYLVMKFFFQISRNQETQASPLPESLQNTDIKKACVFPPLSARPWLRP